MKPVMAPEVSANETEDNRHNTADYFNLPSTGAKEGDFPVVEAYRDSRAK